VWRIALRHLWWHVRAGLADRLYPDPLLRRNRVLEDRHRGDACFILGSGPSIKQQDLARLAGRIVMTQNHFHAHDQIHVIKPRYHVVVPKYQPKQYDNDWMEWLNSMNERLPANTDFFFDKNTRYLVDRLGLFKDRVFYIRQGYNCAMVRHAPVDLTRSLMGVPTVLPECLAVAIYMGFAKVYLLGFDLDQVCRVAQNQQVRFYGTSPVTKNQAEQDLDRQAQEMGLIWINWWMIWRQCYLLRDAAAKCGVEILNATAGGLLNMFPRVKYEEVV